MKNHSAEMLQKKMEDQRRYQSHQGFTGPRPSACRPRRDYGDEYEQEAGELKLWEKCLLAAGVVFVLVMCMMLKG